MKKFSDKIDDIFYSLGRFSNDYKTYLKSLDPKEQSVFIQELYEVVTLDGINDKIKLETEASLRHGIENYKFRYSEEDMTTALNSHDLAGERLFSNSEDKLRYRATHHFHERKRSEVNFSTNEIESLYKSITERIEVQASHDGLINKDPEYSFAWEPLTFNERWFSKEKLNQFLRTEDFKSCFYLDSHYTLFKSNTFTCFNNGEGYKILSIPIVSGKKNLLARKFQKLFVLTTQLKNEFDEKVHGIGKVKFALVLMANFKDFRANTHDEKSFVGDRKTTLSRMR